LLTKEELDTVFALRKAMNSMPVADVTEQILSLMTQTKSNKELLTKIESFIKKFK
jgi:transcription termination factor Rho